METTSSDSRQRKGKTTSTIIQTRKSLFFFFPGRHGHNKLLSEHRESNGAVPTIGRLFFFLFVFCVSDTSTNSDASLFCCFQGVTTVVTNNPIIVVHYRGKNNGPVQSNNAIHQPVDCSFGSYLCSCRMNTRCIIVVELSETNISLSVLQL